MPPKRIFVITVVLLATVLGLTSLRQTVSATPQATTLLYDSSLANTPSAQNFSYLALNPNNPNPFDVQASQSYSAPVTVLNTGGQLNDYAGYTVNQAAMPALDRAAGYQLRFDLRVVSETHANNDRAGFSVILLSEDLYGVEIAFWETEIWVQEGNGSSLFTQAEGTLYDTTAALTTYKLTVIGSTYSLAANGTALLSGNLRQYTDWEPPVAPPPIGPLPDPYEQPNQLFLGDDTAAAGAEVWLGDVAIETEVAPAYSLYLPYLSKP